MNLEDVQKKYKQFINQPIIEEYVPFSLLSLNAAFGHKGLRQGRLIQIVGNSGTGKSTLSLDIMSNAQRLGKECGYIDFERTYDMAYAKKIGINTDTFYHVKPDTAERGLLIAEELVKSGCHIIVFDSIPMALPSSELEKDYDDSEKMAVAAGFLTRALKRFITLADVYTASIIFINQFRANISTMARKESKPYGSRALQYAVSVSIELSRIKTEEDRTTIQAFVAKNKTGAGIEGVKTEYVIEYGKGLDIAGDILSTALQYDIIQKKGAWFYYGELKAQGLEQAKNTFPLVDIKQACIERL